MNKWLTVAAQLIDKVPIERFLFRPKPREESLRELKGILKTSYPITPLEPEPPSPEPEDEPKVHLSRHVQSSVSTEETVAYQNREIAKHLLSLEKHYAQKLTIAGKKCDCGQSRHLLGIESEAEQTISMVDNPDVYYRLLEWVRTVGPKSTVEAAQSGAYDHEYEVFSRQARDFRKEIIGSLDPKALFPQRLEEGNTKLPVLSDEDRARIKELPPPESTGQ